MNSTTEMAALNLDKVYEFNLKIFGDVFESLIGAIFLDSQSLTIVQEMIHRIMKPYIKVYQNLPTLQDHGRTKLLELWNSKPYTRKLRCYHTK